MYLFKITNVSSVCLCAGACTFVGTNMTQRAYGDQRTT